MATSGHRHYLKEWRLKRGLSQEELGQRIGSAKAVISRYESGERGMTLEVQFALMAALEIEPAQFFSDPDDNVATVAFGETTPEEQQMLLRKIRAFIKA